MRLASGTTDQKAYFVLYADTGTNPGTKRMPGVFNTKLTVKYSRDGSAWTTYTTPTVDALDTGAPGVFALTLDEGTTLSAGNLTEEYALHIDDTGTHIRPVTRTIELYRTDTGNVADAVWNWAGRTVLDTGISDAVLDGVADRVWDEADTGHGDTGTFGRLRGGVNIKKVNTVTVTGTGASGDEWKP